MTWLYTGSYFTVLDELGNPVSGAQLSFFEAGTSTPITTYSDSALSVANPDPVVADSAGRVPTIFLATDNYKVVVEDSLGNMIDTQDNYTVDADPTFLSKRVVNSQTGTTYTIQTTDRAKYIEFSNVNPVAVTIPQADSSNFPDGFYFEAYNANTGSVTLQPNTSTIDGLASIVLAEGQGVTVISDGTNYKITGYTGVNIIPNAQTGTTYTFLKGDKGKLVTFTNASAIAATLPQASVNFPAGWFCLIKNLGDTTLTITPSTSTINGAASLVVPSKMGGVIVSDGTNYNFVATLGDGNLSITGNEIASVDTDGDISLNPNGAGRVDVNTSIIENVTDPTAAQHAATKNYVDENTQVRVSSTDVSASATQAITGIGAEERYVLKLNGITVSTDNSNLSLRTSTDGGSSYDSGASDYAWMITGRSLGGAVQVANEDAADSNIDLTSGVTLDVDSAATSSLNGHITIYRPSNTSTYTFISWELYFVNGNGDLTELKGAGQRLATSDVDAVQLQISSGTFSGNIQLWEN